MTVRRVLLLTLAAGCSLLATSRSPWGMETPAPRMPDKGWFIENRGQWDERALFLASSPGLATWVTPTGLTLDAWTTSGERRRGHVLRMAFVGAERPITEGQELLSGTYNYLLGNRPENWTTDVRRFDEVRTEELYPGIDVRWYFDGGRPRYDFIVAPGADPRAIAMRWEGATTMAVRDGTLRLGTSIGVLEHRDLRAFQVVGGHRRPVECSMAATGATVRFQVGDYDRSRPLVIDPVIFATHLGGTDIDEASDLALDKTGRPIVVGGTYSNDFPTTAGAYDRVFSLQQTDGFVTKMTADGSDLVWSTFLGGTQFDSVESIATTATYDMALTGFTASHDFPTLSPMDAQLQGSGDAYVTLLAGNGKSLVFSTYLGGSSSESGTAIAVDQTGRFVVAGDTLSSDFPNAVNGYAAGWDGFLAVMKSDGSALDYARYLGGSDLDQVRDLSIDQSGYFYVCGRTLSSNFPVSAGVYDTTYGGVQSAFVSRVGTDGTYFGTFLQGTATAEADGIRVGFDGSVLISGTAWSGFPTTIGAFDTTHNGSSDHFASRMNATLTSLLASTYVGGAGYDSRGCKVDLMPNGTIALLGRAAEGYPTTATSFNSNTYPSMVAVVRLSADLSKMIYSTSAEGTRVSAIVSSGAGTVVIAGGTQIGTAPTGNAYMFDPLATDGFVAKLDLVPSVVRSSARTFVGGITSATGSIVLPSPAPAGGTPVSLATTYSTIEVPETVTVPQGSKSVTFPIVSRTTLNARDRVVLTAQWGTKTHGIQLDVLFGGLHQLTLQHNTLTGGRKTTGKVLLSANAPTGGRVVNLSTSDPVVTLPAQVVVPQWVDNTTFALSTVPVAVRHTVTVTAALKNETRTQILIVNP